MSATVVKERRASTASASRTVSTRAWGSVNAVPMATRSARRASGSALVRSSTRPSQPSAAALRTTAPTLAGLSTASSTTRSPGRPGQVVERASRRSLEHGQDRLDPPQAGHTPAQLLAGAEQLDAQPVGDGRRPRRVDERRDGSAAGGQRPLDDEVALGQEVPRPAVVASLRTVGQAAVATAEPVQPGVVGIVDDLDVHQKWCGKADQSGGRFSRNESRPSAASSLA